MPGPLSLWPLPPQGPDLRLPSKLGLKELAVTGYVRPYFVALARVLMALISTMLHFLAALSYTGMMPEPGPRVTWVSPHLPHSKVGMDLVFNKLLPQVTVTLAVDVTP
jgi:hypothetical protein